MYDHLLNFFLSQPARIVALGRALVRCGSFLTLAGLAARVTAIDVAALVRSGQSQYRDLAQVFPTFPTWWVPESLPAFCVAGLVIGLGVYVALVGKRLGKLIGH
jgi:hypothetical protein